MSTPSYTILTPQGRAGAIAMIELRHPDPESIGLCSTACMSLRLADFFGVDRGVLLAMGDDQYLLMPHGGRAVVSQIAHHLESLGVAPSLHRDPTGVYREAHSEIEAWCMHALATAPGSMAVDLLLGHSLRWSKLGIETRLGSETTPALRDDCALRHIIAAPTVVSVGRANIGKSSLINALVGQQVSLVADASGTTRDHVGVQVDLAGLVVRWIDTPGLEPLEPGQSLAEIEAEALELARRTLARADLVVHCIDADDPIGTLDPRLEDSIPHGVGVVRVGTRSDRGEHLAPIDCRVQLVEPISGIPGLVERLRDTLVPPELRSSDLPWRFWLSCPASGSF